ncbi:Uncharacterised protein [Mycoplasmopsis maculosa]|uniref:Lipoprotein n=1 Tax=Mycoplasmopsis maculosa TaxID=114885 RepID=A0A449B491_9BACT|nr:hypothetical protein [Mycoplasmopsis maculosa]VEU75423.1 Uncharacterised protein [Mycoplasmopsis maculosa]
MKLKNILLPILGSSAIVLSSCSKNDENVQKEQIKEKKKMFIMKINYLQIK